MVRKRSCPAVSHCGRGGRQRAPCVHIAPVGSAAPRWAAPLRCCQRGTVGETQIHARAHSGAATQRGVPREQRAGSRAACHCTAAAQQQVPRGRRLAAVESAAAAQRGGRNASHWQCTRGSGSGCPRHRCAPPAQPAALPRTDRRRDATSRAECARSGSGQRAAVQLSWAAAPRRGAPASARTICSLMVLLSMSMVLIFCGAAEAAARAAAALALPRAARWRRAAHARSPRQWWRCSSPCTCCPQTAAGCRTCPRRCLR